MRPDTNKSTTGDCECCDRTAVVVTRRHNTLMCAHCIGLEQAAEARQKSVETIEKSHEIDASIQIKSDIWNAATVPLTELRAAIQNNPDIPDAEKDYALFKEADARIKQFDAAIHAKKVEIMAAQDSLAIEKNARDAWVRNAQELAAKLQGQYREKAKQYDLSYKPVEPTKKVKKGKTIVVPTKHYRTPEVYAAAKKYDVPVVAVQSLLIAKNGMSPEAAAKDVAKLMGKL